jgi:hypothetical protein
MRTVIRLYRPVGPEELALIEQSGWRRFPPRLPEQPIFYPVLQIEYAMKIARNWNVPEKGSGFVTMFDVDATWLSEFELHPVGGEDRAEFWIPAERLEEFNDHIVGRIELLAAFQE